MKWGIVAIVFVFVALGCAGSSDLEHEKKMQNHNESMCRDMAYPKKYCEKKLNLKWG